MLVFHVSCFFHFLHFSCHFMFRKRVSLVQFCHGSIFLVFHVCSSVFFLFLIFCVFRTFVLFPMFSLLFSSVFPSLFHFSCFEVFPHVFPFSFRFLNLFAILPCSIFRCFSIASDYGRVVFADSSVFQRPLPGLHPLPR